MGRPYDAARLLLAGDSPSQIAMRMGITVSSVMGYLFRQAGEGFIQRSDIVLSIDRKTRLLVEVAIQELKGDERAWRIVKRVKKKHSKVNELDVQEYLKLRAAKVQFGDLYDSIREIETSLHSAARNALVEEYGKDWWSAVPESVRTACTSSRRTDKTPAEDLYSYTTFIHMSKIFRKNWAVLSKKLPGQLAEDRRAFESKLNRLNEIRNAVMHPVKGMPLDDEAFKLVRRFQHDLDLNVPSVGISWSALLASAAVTGPVQ